LIHTVNITSVGADNATWYALILKYDQSEQSVLIAKFDNVVFLLDPSTMTRESLRVRSYERCFNYQEANTVFYQEIGRCASLSGYSTVFTNRERPIFDSKLTALMARFPKKDAADFTSTALRRAYDQINGSPTKISARERELMRQLEAEKSKNRRPNFRQKKEEARRERAEKEAAMFEEKRLKSIESIRRYHEQEANGTLPFEPSEDDD